MNSSIVLTFIVDDEPGRIKLLSQTVVANHGNWLESRMSCLAGKFAGIARIEIADDAIEALTEALRALQSHGYTIALEKSSAAAVQAAGLKSLKIGILGQDRPGIVHEVAQALAQHHINVVELTSDVTSAPMTGEPLFEAEVDAEVSEEVKIEELRSALEGVANDLNIEISIAVVAE